MRRLRAVVLFVASAVVIQSCTSSSEHSSNAPPDGGPDAASPQGGSDTAAGGVAGAEAVGGGIPNGGRAGGAAGESGKAGADEAGEGGAAGATPHSPFAWQVSYDQSYAAHVAVDSQGAAVVSGTIFDTKDITLGKTTLKSHGPADVALSRVLSSGVVDWARNYGGTAEDYPVSFVLDAQNRIVLTGLYNGTGNLGGADFQPFAGTTGRLNVSVAEFEANGDPRWSHTMNSTAEAFAAAPAVNAAGEVFVAGSFLATTTIGGAPHTSLGSWDAFLARYDEPNGAFNTVLPFGGTDEDRAIAVLLTSTDEIVLGNFAGSVTFPTTPVTTLVSAGGSDVFVARVSPAGKMTSVVAFGGTTNDVLTTAQLDSLGGVVLVGNFSSPSMSVLGGQALHTVGGLDMFVARLTPDLVHDWSVSFGSDADDAVRDLSIGPQDTLAITGEFRDHLQIGNDGWDAVADTGADAGTGPTQIDFFVAKLDSSGHPLWSFAAGGPGQERGLGVAADKFGGLFVTASFTSSIDFGGGKVLSAAAGQFGSALIRYVP